MNASIHAKIAGGFVLVFALFMGIQGYHSAFLPQQTGGLLLFFASGVFIVLFSFMYLVGALIAMYRKRGEVFPVMILASILYTASVPLASHASKWAYRVGEDRWIDRFGADALRTAAAKVLAEPVDIAAAPGLFGSFVPPMNVPEPLGAFSHGRGLERLDQGVLYRMNGTGNVPGGCLVTPPESTFVPPDSRVIRDGFYYMIKPATNTVPDAVTATDTVETATQ